MADIVSDRITRTVEIEAPVARVWRALTDHREFGTWFRARIDTPFAVGETARGQMTEPGWEHAAWESKVVAMEPERRFAFLWPHTEDAGPSKDGDPFTLVEFVLEPTDMGTRLTVSESGFEALPEARRSTVLRENARGWEIQAGRIRAHVAANP